MDQSPSFEANNHSTNQGISYILWNPEVHYRVHKIPSLIPILSHINYSPHLPILSQTHSNIILLSILRSCEWSLPFRFSDQHVVYSSHLSYDCYMPSQSPWSVKVTKLLTAQSPLASCHAIVVHMKDSNIITNR
jgi:hypothetical protein